MAAAVSAIYALTLLVDETLGLSQPHAADPTMRHEVLAHSGVINGSSSPAATKVFSGIVTVTGGTANLDLTSLDGPQGSGTVDLTGLKPQKVFLSAHVVNVVPVTIKTKDTTTGYNLFGADNTGSEEHTLNLGQAILLDVNDKGEDVDATHKDITFTAAGSGNTVHVQIVAG